MGVKHSSPKPLEHSAAWKDIQSCDQPLFWYKSHAEAHFSVRQENGRLFKVHSGFYAANEIMPEKGGWKSGGKLPQAKIMERRATSASFLRRFRTNERDPEASSFENAGVFQCSRFHSPHLTQYFPAEYEVTRDPNRPIKDFLSAVSGKQVLGDASLTLQQQAYINFIKDNLENYPMSLFTEILHGPNKEGVVEIDSDEIFALLTSIAQSAQKGGQFSIETALKQAVEDEILNEETLKGPLHQKALSILFSCVAWISMLYPPVPPTPPLYENITIDRSECLCIADSQPISNTNRPVCEIIQEFGPLLPVRRDSVIPNTSDSVFSAESIYVSLLNASTLTQIGGIQIEWVTNVSSHLAFDPETPKLMIFSLPSFCRISEDQCSSFAK
jgi:hypothetical protein